MPDYYAYSSGGALWLTVAIINAGLAEGKGRSRWYWFLFSLFLGPIASAAIVIWPRVEKKPKS